jgi:hypothetical protein
MKTSSGRVLALTKPDLDPTSNHFLDELAVQYEQKVGTHGFVAFPFDHIMLLFVLYISVCASPNLNILRMLMQFRNQLVVCVCVGVCVGGWDASCFLMHTARWR